MDDKKYVLDPGVQPLSPFECQVADEIIESETDDKLIMLDSLPLFFNAFHIMKGKCDHILADNHKRKHEVSEEPMLPSKSPHDPIVDALDGFCFQSQSSFVHNSLKIFYDMDMIRQSSLFSDLV